MKYADALLASAFLARNRCRSRPEQSLARPKSGRGHDMFTLARNPSIEGFAVGRTFGCAVQDDEYVLKIYVNKTRLRSGLSTPIPRRLILSELNLEIEIDIEETEPLRVQAAAQVPVYGGGNISRFDGQEGTLGCVVTWKNSPGAFFILSNAHVLALTGENPPAAGDAIIHPSRNRGGTAPANTIAELTYWTRFDSGLDYPNVADAAIAKIVGNNIVSPAIDKIGLPAGLNENLSVGMQVRLSGAESSPSSYGTVQALDGYFDLTYPQAGGPSRTYGFSRQVVCSPFTKGGDSGAVVLDSANRVVGLHLAGSDDRSVFTPIRSVLDLLDISLVTDTSSGDAAAAATADSALPLGFKPPVVHFYSAVDVLGRTIWGEARNQKPEGMIAVAAVVANRARAQEPRWGQTVEEVCKKRLQFSCWNDNDPNYDKLLAVGPDDIVFAHCVDIARQTINGQIVDPTGGATSYCNLAVVTPSWTVGKVPCATIGQHTFYKV